MHGDCQVHGEPHGVQCSIVYTYVVLHEGMTLFYAFADGHRHKWRVHASYGKQMMEPKSSE